MAKLYPPAIAGTLPAFTGYEIVVPFSMNRSVSQQQVSSMAIKIKHISSNALLAYSTAASIDYDTMEARFALNPSTSKISAGHSYKVQIAYVETDTGEVGYYSTVGVVKCTYQPQLQIDGLSVAIANAHNFSYVGRYTQQTKDPSEKVYSYRFDVIDSTGALFATSGELLHNHENDELPYESFDTFTVNKELDYNVSYYIQYFVTTTNGLKANSPRYRILQQDTVDPDIKSKLVAELNHNNGYINLRLEGHKEDGVEELAVGTFVISRASSEDDFGTWNPVLKFVLYGEHPSRWLWKDFTVQHGYTYLYAIQQYNKDTKLYSNRIYSEPVEASFEDCFLYDGERQLKIRFNPKINSFKQDVLETKTDTIGGKYPFISRNGNVYYKEFPISGLISYHSDEEELFMTDEDLGFSENLAQFKRNYTLEPDISKDDEDYFNNLRDSNVADRLRISYAARDSSIEYQKLKKGARWRNVSLESYNMLAERIFKLKVLEFLTDGKPKLFRSPAEGNYLVRLMNTSLSPEVKVGRMLHTFSCTAYEIAEPTYFNLDSLGIIATHDPSALQLRWETMELAGFGLLPAMPEVPVNYIPEGSFDDYGNPIEQDALSKKFDAAMAERANIIQHNDDGYEIRLSYNKVNNHAAHSIQCRDMLPGDIIEFGDAPLGSGFNTTVVIGNTGAYMANFSKPVQNIGLQGNPIGRTGSISYSYYGSTFNQFNTYEQISINDIPIKQYYGEVDIFEDIEDLKHRITGFYLLHFSKREVKTVYSGQYVINEARLVYEDKELTKPVTYNPLYLYKIMDLSGGYKYADGRLALKNKFIEPKDYKNKVIINGDRDIDITETNDFELREPSGITSIQVTNGVISDVAVQRKEIKYTLENTDQRVISARQNYINALNNLQYLISDEVDETYMLSDAEVQDTFRAQTIAAVKNQMYDDEFSRRKTEVEEAYKIYLEEIRKVLLEMEEEIDDVE